MTHLVGYGLALCVGASLGLMGSGGSLLTVPVLVYLFRFDPVAGTAYSLFIVGATSLVGLTLRARSHKVNFPATLVFAVPSLFGVFLVRKYVIHSLPTRIPLPLGWSLERDALLMSLFALVLLGAGIAMISGGKAKASRKASEEASGPGLNLPLIGSEGLAVGTLTGLVGAGGGFLIVPVLVLSAYVPMEAAVSTSLAIITTQCLVGFLSDWSVMGRIHWPFLLAFTFLSISGVFGGVYLARYLSGKRLKKALGGFMLVVALGILGKEWW